MMIRRADDNIRLFVLDNGRMYVRAEELEDDGAMFDANDETAVELPIYAVLIQHPDGLVLFDTGCHPDAMKPHGRWSNELQQRYPWHATKEELLINQLSSLGVSPDDIRYVICSHLHCDHAGNLEFFRNSEILVHEDEWSAAMREYNDGVLDGQFVFKDVQEWVRQDLSIRCIDQSTQSFELLPNLTIHNLGKGHSYGMLVLEVNVSGDETLILASDAAFSKRFYGNGKAPRTMTLDESGYFSGTIRLQQLAQERKATVLFGHDMNQFNTLNK